jgi:hypothetical protein
VVYFGGFFAKLGHFAGFSLYIITDPVRINEAAMGGTGDIIFIILTPKWIKKGLAPSENPSE